MNATLTLARMEWDVEDCEWLVIDRDGDIHDAYADRSDAREAVNALNDEYREQAELGERDSLIDEIQEIVSNLDVENLDLLRRIRDMLASK